MMFCSYFKHEEAEQFLRFVRENISLPDVDGVNFDITIDGSYFISESRDVAVVIIRVVSGDGDKWGFDSIWVAWRKPFSSYFIGKELSSTRDRGYLNITGIKVETDETVVGKDMRIRITYYSTLCPDFCQRCVFTFGEIR